MNRNFGSDERSNTYYDIPPALLRQRRNVIAVSLVLAFLSVSGASITNVHVPGLAVELKREGAVFIFLWIVWAYFGVRYLQYYRLFNDTRIRSAFEGKLYELADKRIARRIEEDIEGFDKNVHQITQFENGFSLLLQAETKERGYFDVSWEVNKRGATNTDDRQVTRFNIGEFDADQAVATRYSLAVLPYVTDYYLPFVVFTVSGLIGLVMNWGGSPIWYFARL